MAFPPGWQFLGSFGQALDRHLPATAGGEKLSRYGMFQAGQFLGEFSSIFWRFYSNYYDISWDVFEGYILRVS
jgi:hypothetical protein